ncbi:hypothetical protein Ais01nite_25380 [Asanoa ishikariensis]|nr:hypothetical protein Ais01nite_25380 [Asanoa ishikariensis]
MLLTAIAAFLRRSELRRVARAAFGKKTQESPARTRPDVSRASSVSRTHGAADTAVVDMAPDREAQGHHALFDRCSHAHHAATARSDYLGQSQMPGPGVGWFTLG